MSFLYHTRRRVLAHGLVGLLQIAAIFARLGELGKPHAVPVPNGGSPEDLDPTEQGRIENPYAYYRWLRDERPVYKPKGQDFYCISRYEDIQNVARNTQSYSSNIVSVLMEKMLGKAMMPSSSHGPGVGSRRNFGVTPVDVLAIQDPPAHKYQKLLTHRIVAADFVRELEPQVEQLAGQLIDQFIDKGETEFMATAAWKLPMLMAMRLLGHPEEDFPMVKRRCSHSIRLLAGTTSRSEFLNDAAHSLKLFQYCWERYRQGKAAPPENIAGGLMHAALDPEHPLSDEEAVSIILQLLLAGSDSSASTLGNALRLLIEDPQLQDQLRAAPELIDNFIEEVLRLESAFQGHFRLLTQDSELQGVDLPRGTRVFLLWASGNRDERFWGEDADSIDLQRQNMRRHLTFGYGMHACLGRELARMEIRVMIHQLLRRTENIRLAGKAEHVSSLFTRTLLELPVRFDKIAKPATKPSVLASANLNADVCPLHNDAA
ncbi:MAG: cytochrome P450 [Oceanococcus sp.]